MNTTSSITDELRAQWANPLDISTILLVIGGDVVQKAFARGTGKVYTPVCFSFGCVAYVFIALVSIIGEGRLLPPPDYPAKVINLESGSVRENKNWVLARVLRDLETERTRKEPCDGDSIRITVFGCQSPARPRRVRSIIQGSIRGHDLTRFAWSRLHIYGLLFTFLQVGVAIWAWEWTGDWTILLITLVGTILVQVIGALPQWTAEKLPGRQNMSFTYALTAGNGSKDIIIIVGGGKLLDLEELATQHSPRSSRLWEKFDWLSKTDSEAESQKVGHQRPYLRRSRNLFGIPLGFWLTRIVCISQSVLWLLLLINVGAPKHNSWYLLAIGGIGMFQNAYLAAIERPSNASNIPLDHVETIHTKKVMDGIMDFHDRYGMGEPLLREYFSYLSPKEELWWGGDRDPYERERAEKPERRRATQRGSLEPYIKAKPTILRKSSALQSVERMDMAETEFVREARFEPATERKTPRAESILPALPGTLNLPPPSDSPFSVEHRSTGESGTLVPENRMSLPPAAIPQQYKRPETPQDIALAWTGSHFPTVDSSGAYNIRVMDDVKMLTKPTQSRHTDGHSSLRDLDPVRIPTSAENGVM